MKQFLEFRLDTVNHRLYREDERVSIAPKAFDLLRYLVQHAHRLVTQDEILDALWSDVHVNPEVVKKYILEIRKALGDRSEKPTFIETFPRRGYQFVAPISETEEFASVVAQVTAAMVGRDAEQARLEGYLDDALQGRRQIVFVSGEAGAGKTTLVDAFLRCAAMRAGVRVARGQCVEGFGGKEPYYPLLEAFGALLRESDRNDVAHAFLRYAPTWLLQFPSLVKSDAREALQRDTLGSTRERMVREIGEALEHLTRDERFVLVLEDLHWADLSTLDVVSALSRRRGPAKLLILGTFRPADGAAAENPLRVLVRDLVVHRLGDEISLGDLGVPEVAAYLAAEFPGADFPADLAGVIQRHSGGNALFMATLVRDMVERGMIVGGSGPWSLARPLSEVETAVPPTLQQVLEVQYAMLDAVEQRVLNQASVAGDRFSAWALATEPDLTSDEIEDVCERLAEQRHFLRPSGFRELGNGIVSAHYEFRHGLVRHAVSRRLTDVSRSRLHRLLGARLSALSSPGRRELAGEIALHFEEGRQYGPAVEHLIFASENAGARFAYLEAIRILEHAMALVPRLEAGSRADAEIRLLERIGDAHYWLGGMMDSVRAYEAAAVRAAGAGLTEARIHALSALVRPFGLIDPDRGIAAIEEAVALCAGSADPLLRGRTELLAAGSRLLYDAWRQEDWKICESAHRSLQRLDPAGVPAFHRMIFSHVKLLQGCYDEALADLESGIPKTNEPVALMVHLFALSGKTVALLQSGRLGVLLGLVRSGRAAAEKNGNDPWLFDYREAWLRTIVFDFEGALRLCEAVAGRATPYLRRQPETIARFAMGYAELERGHHEKAARCFAEILDSAITAKFFLHWYWRMRAQMGLSEVWLAARDLSRARRDADRFLASALQTSEPNLHALGWDLQARVSKAEKSRKGAVEAIERGLEVARRFRIPTVAWRLHATRSELYRRAKNDEAAEAERARAEKIILALADSFDADEPLRLCFLSAPPVRRILKRRPPVPGARQK
ncbi:MAG TPA: AAA family ATPase [Candidatus Polarisedimenticolia bacterium]|nr:AAA family ATPase [Candidatus Polarisedimenticolia bacterium]